MTSSLLRHIEPGNLLVTAQTMGEPTALLDELFSQVDGRQPVRLFAGMSLTDVFTRAPDNVEMSTFVGLGANGPLISQGRMQVISCHMSDLVRSLSDGPLVPDVALVLVSPPDRGGMCSLGVTSDYAWHALASARVVLAEVNEQVPVVAGDTMIPYDRLDAAITTNRALPEQLPVAPSPLEQVIAANVARFVSDGTCLQVGVGRLGEAILSEVSDRRDLGFHSGMVGDTVLEMVRDGVITNAKKSVDRGLAVAGSILGSRDAVALASKEPSLRLRSIQHTHSAEVISSLENFLCVNSAIEVDLLGQVNSEVADGRLVGGIGGAVDYLRGAIGAPGGRSVVALPATAKSGTISRIVPAVQRVTALRSDVDVIVTENGVAELRHVSDGERARRLIAIAAPEHQDALRAAAHLMGL